MAIQTVSEFYEQLFKNNMSLVDLKKTLALEALAGKLAWSHPGRSVNVKECMEAALTELDSVVIENCEHVIYSHLTQRLLDLELVVSS
jgi:hypothetical protein